ncbi:MAG: hypothetical protein HY360_01290 [Verrucomicrobia bacterium]|nr:hypothetical protein [Verrucomicrobiota bacterium]
MFTFTVKTLVKPRIQRWESTFVLFFQPLFAELKECFLILDGWCPKALPSQKKTILTRYQVAAFNIGRRLLPIYHGRRFLASYGPYIPSNYGRVFVFISNPDERMIRFGTYDGYQLDEPALIRQSFITFWAFEEVWSIATRELRLVDMLRGGLHPCAHLVETPQSLRQHIT